MKRLVLLLCIASLLLPSGLVPAAQAAPSNTNVPAQNITTAVTWNLAGSPYIIQGQVTVLSGGSLTIEPGVVVKFDPNLPLQVQSGGVLTATGTSIQTVLFTSNAGSPAPGDWGFVQVLAGARARFNYCEFAYGGAFGYWSQLEIRGSDVVVENCAIHDGLNAGVAIEGNGAITPTLRNVNINDNAGFAIQSGVPRVNPQFQNVTLSGNGTNAWGLGYTNFNTAGDSFTLDGYGLNGAPIILPSGLFINSGSVVTVTPGTTVAAATNQLVDVYAGSSLLANGTPSRPITFTVATTSTAPGQWVGLLVREAGGNLRLDHCTVRYAGYNGKGAVEVASPATAQITNCRIENNQNAAIRVLNEIEGLQVNYNHFSGNGYGIDYNTGLPPDVEANTIDARFNSWDHPSGPFNATSNPSGQGQGVDDWVLFRPWIELAGDGPDLVASVTAPAGVNAGDNFNINYTVTNAGTQATSATSWEDAFYLSEDQEFDSSDLPLGNKVHNGALALAASYNAAANGLRMPLVAQKPWYVLAVADHNYQSPDTNRPSNTGASAPVLVQVPTLPMNTPVEGSAPPENGVSYGLLYKFTPPASGNVRLFMTGSRFSVYVRALEAPTASDYDSFLSTPLDSDSLLDPQPNGVLRLKDLPAVPHYVWVWVSPQNNFFSFRLLAEPFTLPEPLAIDSVSPGAIGFGGIGGAFIFGPAAISVTIRGAGFTPATTVTLLDAGNEVAMNGVRYLDENTLRVNVAHGAPGCVMPCNGAVDVRVNDGAQSATLPDGLAVRYQQYISGELPNDTPPCELSVSFTAPAVVRSAREFPVTVTWVNHCGDLTPQVALISSDNARFRLPGDPAPRGQWLELLITNPGDGPLELIPQGASGSLLVMAQPITGGAHVAVPIELRLLQAKVCEPFGIGLRIVCRDASYNAPLQFFRPDHVSAIDWSALTLPTILGFGNTAQGYLDWLTAEAVRLERLGVRTPDVQKLIASALGWKVDPGVLQRQYLGAMGYAVPDPTDIRLVDAGTGDYFLQIGIGRRPFLAQPTGGWRGVAGDNAVLSESGGIFTLTELDGTRMVFLANGRLDYVEDPNGNRVTAHYTGSQLTSYTDTNGDTTTFTYSGQGRLATITDPVGRTVTFTYNAAGNLLTAVDGPTGVTQFQYSSQTDIYRRHAITRVIFPDGNAAHFSYDAQGRLTQQSLNGATEVVNFTFDPATGRTTVTDALGHSMIRELGPFGLAAVTDPLGQLGRLSYNAAGQFTGMTYGGGATVIDYERRGDPGSVTDSLGRVAQMAYAPDTGRLVRFSDPNGNITLLGYDTHANLVEVERADGTAESFDYDSSGRPVQVVNRRGQLLALSYSPKGLLTRKDYPDGRYILFSYNARRSLTQTVEVSGTARLTTTLTYDAVERLTRITYPNGRYVNYQYDSAGRIAHLSDQSGFTVDYDYAASGRLLRVRNSGNTLVEYTYDAAGRMTRAQNGNGTATAYQYDANSRVTRIALLGPGDALQREFVYTFDALGRRLTQATTEGTTTFGYDAVGQLISADLPAGPDQTFTYDPAGNRTQTTANGVPTAYSHNALNQYTAIGGNPLVYDADGNLLSNAGATYTWDADGNLATMNAPGEAWTFEYDALGNRVAATRNGVRTEYLVDPTGLGDLLAEYDGAGTLLTRYVHGQGLVSRIAGGSAAYYGFDGAGNTALLTNPAGAVVNTYRYLPFGDVASATEGVSNPFQFGGKWGMRRTAGLVLSRLRGYSPALGRFVSEEAVSYSTNLYLYAENNPISFTDPDGLEPIKAFEGLGPVGDWLDQMALEAQGVEWLINKGNEPGIRELRDFAENNHNLNVHLPAVNPKQAANIKASTLAKAEKLAQAGSKWGAASKALKAVGGPLDAFQAGVQTYNTLDTFADDYLRYQADPSSNNLATGIENTVLNTVKIPAQFVPFGDHIVDGVYNVGNNTLGRMMYDATFQWETRNTGPQNVLNQEAYHRWIHRRATDQVTSGDPNDIQGPVGYGAPGWLAPQEMLYTIHFENVPTATAPAALVLVTHMLDSDLDPTSVRFWGYGFGETDRAFSEPQAGINEVVDAADLFGVDVRVTATVSGGQLAWLFTTVDPATGGEPAPWLISGFLPPNNADHDGEGWVIFSARPLSGKPTGTPVNAQARVFFDDNPFIDTNVHVNTLDTVPPTATVAALPATSSSPVFTVSWSGSDEETAAGAGPAVAGSGVASYDVWLGINGDWSLWLAGTLETSAVFTGTAGTLYEFVALARDNAGNRLAIPPSVQALTFVSAGYRLFLPLVIRQSDVPEVKLFLPQILR